MNRKSFLHTAGLGVLSLPFFVHGIGSIGLQRHDSRSMLLSSFGSGRASGYAEANKILTLHGKTHVTWLNSKENTFQVMIRTFDHRKQKWSPAYEVGDAYDNHGGAALTVDSKGYLHIIYYPHHREMRYRISSRPNDASAWEEEQTFGERCTYPSLICGKDDTLYFTCRRSFDEQNWQVELWKKAPDQSWVGPHPLLRSQYPGYAHFQESLAWGPGWKTLHVCCRIHEKTDDEAYGRIQTVGYMKSSDFGQSWTDSAGQTLNLPVTSSSIERLAVGGVDAGSLLRAGAMTTDLNGNAWLVYSKQENGLGDSYLVKIAPASEKQQIPLKGFLPKEYQTWDLIMSGGVSCSVEGDLFVVAQIQQIEDMAKSWGHPSTEIVLFHSQDHGETFGCQQISPANPGIPNWLPNIERKTGHNIIKGKPAVLYTAGTAGSSNTDILSNEVYCWI